MANRENTPIINGQTKFAKARAGILFAIKMVIVVVALVLSQGFACPQSTRQQKEPARRADITSGKNMFLNYCASCHGVDGKGNGPAAAALKPAPTNLTTLAKANEGKYPAGFVTAMLKFGRNPAAHGSSEMPVWGSRFKMIDPSQDPTGQQQLTMSLLTSDPYNRNSSADCRDVAGLAGAQVACFMLLTHMEPASIFCAISCV